MEWVERTDRTVDAAKDFLLDQLGVDEDEAEFEILEEPKPGLFGRVRGQARVRARVAPQTPRAKEDRNRRKGRAKPGDRSDSAPKEKAAKAPAAKKPAPPAPAKAETAEGDAPARRAPRQPAGASNGNGGSRQSTASDRPPADPAAIAPAITTFLDELARSFGLTATATVKVTEEGELEGSLDGEGLGALIGPGGDVIGAIQELARTVAQKESHGGQAPRLRVDVGGYRAERRISLAAFTKETAQKVLETGSAHALEPMGSIDRKIVHDAAGEVDGVVTRSDGEEPSRRVVIAPA